MGAGKIYAIGTRPNCAALAREYGATNIISYREGDIVEQIMDLNHGQVDKVILAIGSKPVNKLAEELKDTGIRIEVIGDAVKTGLANKAIKEGFNLGRSL